MIVLIFLHMMNYFDYPEITIVFCDYSTIRNLLDRTIYALNIFCLLIPTLCDCIY